MLLPPLECVSIVNGDPLMSNASASNGTCTKSGVGEKMVADVVEEIWTISCMAAVDNSPPRVIINTLCLKDARFLELDAGAIAMVEQLPPILTAIAGAGDDALNVGDMVEGLAGVAIATPEQGFADPHATT